MYYSHCVCTLKDKVYDEIYQVMGDGDQTVTIEDTVKFVYLEQCIRETLRLYPVGPIILRRLLDDVKISKRMLCCCEKWTFTNNCLFFFSLLANYTIPKGTTVIIPPIATHHLPELYPNPWSFNPNNFDPEQVAKRHKYSFIAFSGGPRGCIGKFCE